MHLASGGTRSYCYDAAGNLTSDNTGFTARHDAIQRPLQVARSANTIILDNCCDGDRLRQTGSTTRSDHPTKGSLTSALRLLCKRPFL